MKHIIFLANFNSVEDADIIQAALSETRLSFSHSVATGSVTIEGQNDDLYLAKQVLMQAGYVVK